jgi:hypothetical protein
LGGGGGWQTINDVLLGMIGASLRRYLEGRYNEASTLPANHNTCMVLRTNFASQFLQSISISFHCCGNYVCVRIDLNWVMLSVFSICMSII